MTIYRAASCSALIVGAWLSVAGPAQARFLQVDPVGYKDDPNMYAYVGNDPVNKADPLGLYICSGNSSDCGTVDAFVATAHIALKGLEPNSDAAKKVSAVLTYIGKSGENNGVVFNPTVLGKGILASAGSNGQINVDTAKIAKDSPKFGSANPNMSRSDLRNATGAGAIVHEGRHELDSQRLWQGGGPPDKAAEQRTEMNAYGTQAGVWKGLGFNTSLWHPGMTQEQMEKAIIGAAQNSVESWCKSGGSCQ